jgi:hypothetical protein
MGQGREAATVRQAILIVLLIAAAFLGGAFVTGPGLQWAQARLLRSLGLSNGGEIAAVDLESGVIGTDPAELPKSQVAAPSEPIAPMPRVLAERKSSKQDAFDRIPPAEPGGTPSTSNSGSNQSRPLSLPSATPPRSVTKSSARGQALVDPKVSPAGGDSLSSRSGPATQTQGEKSPPPALLDSLATLSPAAESSSDSERPPSTRRSHGSKSPEANGDEWAMLVSKMQTLGVSRFSVEGEPGGQVVFACLIPLAGRQAVTQRFESSGDDVIQAARAALRRVILWRATQLPRDNSPAPGEKNER